jgi:hypothetical protein
MPEYKTPRLPLDPSPYGRSLRKTLVRRTAVFTLGIAFEGAAEEGGILRDNIGRSFR